MPRYEYNKIDLNSKSDDLDLLNPAGAQGWRLVFISTNRVAYLIREIAEAPPPPHRRRDRSAESR